LAYDPNVASWYDLNGKKSPGTSTSMVSGDHADGVNCPGIAVQAVLFDGFGAG
jgi:hypothetical protein